MSVTESDLELLENYLDDELSPDEVDGLCRRLSSEPQLASAIDDLRAQRELRSQFFASVEPNGQTTEQLIRSVRTSMNRQMIWSQRAGLLRQVGSLAACLLVGIIGGYGLRGSLPTTTIQRVLPVAPFAGANQTPVVFPTPNSANPAEAYPVKLIDGAGNLVGVKWFRTSEEANQFIKEFGDLQNQLQQTPGGQR